LKSIKEANNSIRETTDTLKVYAALCNAWTQRDIYESLKSIITIPQGQWKTEVEGRLERLDKCLRLGETLLHGFSEATRNFLQFPYHNPSRKDMSIKIVTELGIKDKIDKHLEKIVKTIDENKKICDEYFKNSAELYLVGTLVDTGREYAFENKEKASAVSNELKTLGYGGNPEILLSLFVIEYIINEAVTKAMLGAPMLNLIENAYAQYRRFIEIVPNESR
jgi:hypothetical protein